MTNMHTIDHAFGSNAHGHIEGLGIKLQTFHFIDQQSIL